MKIYILDSNVVFSAALNVKNSMGRFIMSSAQYEVNLIAPDFLREEIEKYVPKLVELSGQRTSQVRRILNLLYSRIKFVSDQLIPFEHYRRSLPLVRDIDLDDIVFVALAEYMEEELWTGDMKLYHGLRAKGYARVVTFQEIKERYSL